MTPPAQQSEQNMKTNVPVKKQPVEAMTQPPDIQRRINAGWLRLWKTVYPTTPPPTEVRIPSSEAQPPADQLSAAARRDLGSGDTTSDRSDTFCGPIQGEMKAKSEVPKPKLRGPESKLSTSFTICASHPRGEK